MNGKPPRLMLIVLLCTCHSALAQQFISPEGVPPNFTADAAFAAQVRSQLLADSLPAVGPYAIGQEVMRKLLQALPPDRAHLRWELRIAQDAGNVFSSPDGTIFVDEGLAQFFGSQPGLWAAALSHEIAHVRRRDWARRYLFQKSLEEGRASQIVLGQASAFSGSWVDSQDSSGLLASFCQTMELQADAESLMLLARAGFHPDFVPALHHALEAQPGQFKTKFLDAFHPPWDERDQKLQQFLAAAGREYDRLWPARYASPGGNPPIVVYTGQPSAKRGPSGKVDVVVPLHCQNLYGTVEVVLRWTAPTAVASYELRQLTGCTSNRTLITFTLPSSALPKSHVHMEGDVSILDDSGAILTRSRTPIR